MSAPKYFPNWAEKNGLNNKRRIPPIDPAFIVQSPPAGSFDIKKTGRKIRIWYGCPFNYGNQILPYCTILSLHK
jgi:hypothetical protein